MYTDDQIARVCHEANRALQDVQDDPAPSQPWLAEFEEIRQGTIDGVRRARCGVTPRAQHESWVAFKVARGWIRGPEKDIERKTHPCLVDYDELPQAQKDKDMLFLMIVAALSGGVLRESAAVRYHEHGNIHGKAADGDDRRDRSEQHPARVV